MGTTFIGLAIADSMFPSACGVSRKPLTVEQVKNMAATAVSCCNPSHKATLVALERKHGIKVDAPEVAPKVALKVGDRVIVLSVRGLPRETREFTNDEIAGATFAFGIWTVTD